ncbi:RICIN domain-containing protein [Kitasatospora viridis]|uniref:Ricin-type beta-trefoil lectin protein n=1 Tax=Kitasatospora viridis TaxID=281105 RepID=A0A561UIY5_9ACTN|nr:RICIN domain-containing protein [Kitasatospora viridis]TWF99304.1 ricin-type beta-trefoil lectin protein [Kitasatospora viridis]
MTLLPGRKAQQLRFLAVLFAVFGLALGLLSSPLATAPAHAANPAATTSCTDPTTCIQFQSLSNGRYLDAQNGNTTDGVYIVTNSAPGYHENWHLAVDQSDSSFNIVNNDTGKCIDIGWLPTQQNTCAGQASQKWYFQPAANGGTGYMIRHEGDNNCLDLLQGAQYDDAWTDAYSCNGTINQLWTAPPQAHDLAVAHAAAACQKNTASCTWSETSEAPAAPLPKICVSSVWFNNTSGPINQTFGVSQMTGWSDTLSSTVSEQLDIGTLLGLTAKISTTLSVTATSVWNGSSTVNNQVSVPVPSQQYGWVTLSELAKKVTGTWTFDAQGFPWTAADTVSVPLASDPSGGATVYVANTSPTFSTCS